MRSALRTLPEGNVAWLTWLSLVLGMAVALQADFNMTREAWAERIRAEWIQAEELAVQNNVSEKPTTRADASGGCDGIRLGGYGFHTGESDAPWWQVDLGDARSLESVVIWNRREASERAAKIQVLLSEDGKGFRRVYEHGGKPFGGAADQKPLVVELPNEKARFVRLALPQRGFLHLDEVEVFGPGEGRTNLALGRSADQDSLSPWSVTHAPPPKVDWVRATRRSLDVSERLMLERENLPVAWRQEVEALRSRLGEIPSPASARPLFLQARALQRSLALETPVLRDFDALLFVKRVPGSFNHMSDQYYGWWSKPGGGIYLLRDFRGPHPDEECLTTSFMEPGSFLRPTLSYDGRKVLFAWCRHYPRLAAETNKLDKANVPEDAFYHLFEMNIDGTGRRQLTFGKYDDFDGRYLPDGRIVFLSTRRGQSLQVGRDSAARSVRRADLPDCYVRCGGGPERPVAVYTLHTMDADGQEVVAISPFEMFEWTPEVGHDGAILYSRWDYVDRDNMPYMGLWSIAPDGSNARIVYGNYTKSPHCVFEIRPVPGSRKLVFTASAHHSQTMGSLVLLDPSAGTEGTEPLRRLTPEVPFPEIEGWPTTSYANPWPLSERFYLVSWGCEGARVPGPAGWDRWHAVQRPDDGMAVYWYDAETLTRELLCADPKIACVDPIPVRARPHPPVIASQLPGVAANSGRFLLMDVYRGLTEVSRGAVKALRVVAVPAKTHPTMNSPALGITQDDPGKCVLGTVPVEADGSAYFHVPSGVTLFFQALDSEGMALQTMRSATHVQSGQTLSCIGCHESRHMAPPLQQVMATGRAPSRLIPGPEGSWPLRFDQLVQPVLERQCVACHQPKATNAVAARFDLTPARAYDTLVSYGKPNLKDMVQEGYRRGFSIAGQGLARSSALWRLLSEAGGHYEVRLSAEDRERWVTWMDAYAQRSGHFSEEQEAELNALRRACSDIVTDRWSGPTTAEMQRP